MSTLRYLVPMAIALLGLVGMALYVMAVALGKTTQRLVDMNERLMVLAGLQKGGEAAGRALVASARSPRVASPPSSTKPPKDDKKKKDPEGVRMTIGVH